VYYVKNLSGHDITAQMQLINMVHLMKCSAFTFKGFNFGYS
jgi:hypothetical protein